MKPRCYTEALKRILTLRLSFTFSLQTEKFRVWAMLGSNQRPLPCEGSEAISCAPLRLGQSAYLSRFLGALVNRFSAVFTYVLAGLLHGCCTSSAGPTMMFIGHLG
jgi:hypothetical protein